MKIVVLVSILIQVFLVSNYVFAEKLKIDDFIQRIKKSHPFFAKERLNKKIERESLRGLKGGSDWNLESQADYSRTEPTLAIFSPNKSELYTYLAGVQKPVWMTGGRLTANYSYVRTDNTGTPFGIPSRFHDNKLGISYSQPLLKNRFGIQDRLRYDLKKYDIDVTDIQSRENQESFLEEMVFKYLDWVYLNRRKKILKDRRDLSNASYAHAKRKRRANLIERVDVLRAEDSVRIAEQSLVLGVSDWKAQQAELATILQDRSFDKATPEFNLYKIEKLESRKKSKSNLIKNSRLVRLLDKRIQQLEHSLKGFKNSRLPDVSVFAEYSAKGGDTDYSDSTDFNRKDVQGGVRVTVPFGNNEARGGVDRTKLELAQLKKSREEIIIDLVSAHERLFIQIEDMAKVLKLNLEQIESATEKTKEEQKLYNRGQGDLNFVIQSQDNEQDAKLNYAVNALTYQKLLIQYRSLLDQLF